MHRHPQRILAALLAGAALLAVGGCQLFGVAGVIGQNIEREKKIEVLAEYDGLRSSTCAVVVITDMMVMEPYPGFEGRGFSMPCRNVLPKPMQTPHPPMWMACTNRDTIKVAAQNGLGSLAFSFVDPAEA